MTDIARRPPVAGDPGEDRLASGALRYLNIQHSIVAVVTGAMAAVALAFIPDPGLRGILWTVVAVLVVSSLAVELPWLNRVHVRKMSYTATPEYVYIARGWVWRRSVVVATSQILNVEIAQGPLLRSFGLVSVRLMAIVELERIGPIDRDAADRLRETVLSAQRSCSHE